MEGRAAQEFRSAMATSNRSTSVTFPFVGRGGDGAEVGHGWQKQQGIPVRGRARHPGGRLALMLGVGAILLLADLLTK
jgi:hypothetical protein